MFTDLQGKRTYLHVCTFTCEQVLCNHRPVALVFPKEAAKYPCAPPLCFGPSQRSNVGINV